MEIFKEIFIAIVSSSVVAGIFTFLIRRYIGKWIEYRFDIRKKSLDQNLKMADKVSTYFLDHQLGIYPELQELTYRLLNIMKDGIKQSHSFKWDSSIRPLSAHLTEDLYKYRFFLPSEIFDLLHEFKRITQDAIRFIDMQTREDKLFDVQEYQKHIPEFQKKLERANELYNEIESRITGRITSVLEPK